MALSQMKYVTDLKMVIFTNKSGMDFIICDHPAALTNRFHFQKLHQNSFGLLNSGAVISMPLTPRLSVMCYDSGVYTIPNATGTSFLVLKHENDISALNQIQYLSAAKNIYFRNWKDAELVASEIVAVSEKRTAAGAISKVLVRDHNRASLGEVYRSGTNEERLTAQETMVMTSFRQPDPATWPSVLKFRDKPKTFDNGSAVGHVRKPEWLSGKL